MPLSLTHRPRPPVALGPAPAAPVPDDRLVLVRDDGRLICPRCQAAYLPPLTRGACPVCRTEAPGGAGRARWWVRDDDRLLLLVGIATIANLVVLAVLAIAVLHH
ncbi:MAG TPA: hypothetical protein VHE83_18170 [Mycobacteriales bacterium]|nr:hypothetical protein [Mycobacteriales bacterium]